MSVEAPSAAHLLRRLRKTGAEPTDVEVKAAVGGLPRSVPETLSAFANGAGGTLLLGVAESAGFTPAEGFDPGPIRDALVDACVTAVTPPLRDAVEIEAVEGGRVVRLEVTELDPVEKPCFVSNRGEYGGSFIRGGDGDRRLTRYEVTQLLQNRTQPMSDAEPVAAATLADLDPDQVRVVLRRARERSPRAFGSVDDPTALRLLGAAVDHEGTVRPTLAGLLCLGRYPQQFLPQLFISFVALPGATIGQLAPDGSRFLDNQTIDGTIPQMLAEAMAAAVRNMNRAAIIQGLGRRDRYDYPLDVIRELVVNAVMHRDYSPESRGTQVQVEIYPDRLVVTSPGGLYGGLTPEELNAGEPVSTSRNATLAKLLADLSLPTDSAETIAENRGSGLLRVMAALQQAGMSPPEFDVRITRLRVTVPRHALLAPETIEWIGSLGLPGLAHEQQVALAIMHTSGSVSSGTLRAWGVEAGTAGRALRDLVARGVAVRSGGRRYARYHLAPDLGGSQPELPGLRPGPIRPTPMDVESQIGSVLAAIADGHTTTRQLSDHLDLPYASVVRRVNALLDRGAIRRTHPHRSSKQSYRITDQGETR